MSPRGRTLDLIDSDLHEARTLAAAALRAGFMGLYYSNLNAAEQLEVEQAAIDCADERIKRAVK